MSRSPVLRKGLLWLAALAVWSLCLGRAFDTFAPGTDVNDVGFNSDSAIPVLMSNETRPLGPYRLYYYGADRWGAWPFLVTHYISQATGYRWTDDSVFKMHALWVFIGALVLAGLSREDRFVVGLFYLMALCLHREARFLLFELSQIYGWQSTGVLLGWFGFRRLYSAYVQAPEKAPAWRRLGWLGATFACSYLAIWSSIVSAPLLLFLLHLEGIWGWLNCRAERLWARLLTPYALGLAALAAAIFLEQQQKLATRHYAAARWGYDTGSHFAIDSGYLWENVVQQTSLVAKLSWLPLYVIPVLALVVLAATFAYAVLTNRHDLRARLSAALTSDLAILAVGTYGVAAINFALTILISHVRANSSDTRYLTLTNQFAPVSGMLTVYLVTKLTIGSARIRRYLQPAVVLPALVLLAMRFPAARPNLEYQVMQETALVLAQKAPGGVLLGGYWETYLFTALQPRNALVPVPFEGPFNRMPWTAADVRGARQIIVGYPRPSARADVPMPQTIDQYGCRLRLVESNWYGNQLYAFGLYVNESRR